MYIPNRFAPSDAAIVSPRLHDPTARPVQTVGGDRGLTNTLRVGMTESLGPIAPHLARNIALDMPRRNYTILPGGEQVFLEDVETVAVFRQVDGRQAVDTINRVR